jgi:hypothetical protein
MSTPSAAASPRSIPDPRQAVGRARRCSRTNGTRLTRPSAPLTRAPRAISPRAGSGPPRSDAIRGARQRDHHGPAGQARQQAGAAGPHADAADEQLRAMRVQCLPEMVGARTTGPTRGDEYIAVPRVTVPLGTRVRTQRRINLRAVVADVAHTDDLGAKERQQCGQRRPKTVPHPPGLRQSRRHHLVPGEQEGDAGSATHHYGIVPTGGEHSDVSRTHEIPTPEDHVAFARLLAVRAHVEVPARLPRAGRRSRHQRAAVLGELTVFAAQYAPRPGGNHGPGQDRRRLPRVQHRRTAQRDVAHDPPRWFSGYRPAVHGRRRVMRNIDQRRDVHRQASPDRVRKGDGLARQLGSRAEAQLPGTMPFHRFRHVSAVWPCGP